MSNLDTILSYLQGTLGLSSAQAAGVAGNFQVESGSGFSPTAYNPTERAIGIAQWEGGRRTALQQFAAAHGGSETDLSTQLAFLGNELHGSESGAYSKLLATTDPGGAAAAFDQYYERSSGSARSIRVADAQAIAAGHPTSAGSGSSSSSSSSSSSTSGTSSGTSMASKVGGWMGLGGTFFTVGVKVLGAAAAAGLVIVGATHTVSSS